MCPFIEKADRRCSAYLTMRELDRAFARCADRYANCPVFQELIVHEHERCRAEAPAALAAAS